MKRKLSILTMLIALVLLASSCSKRTYPYDPYRGSANNPYYYKNNHAKFKDTRGYRNGHIKKQTIKPLK